MYESLKEYLIIGILYIYSSQSNIIIQIVIKPKR